MHAPCSDGKSPVNIVTCEGNVHGAADRAMSKVMPAFAHASSWGVVGRGYP